MEQFNGKFVMFIGKWTQSGRKCFKIYNCVLFMNVTAGEGFIGERNFKKDERKRELMRYI